jgi:hypothetical protein
MVPADPTAAPNLVLSRYTDWPDPLAIDWNTTGRLKNIILPIAMPGIANRWFAVPGFAFNVKIPLDYVDTSPCWEDPRARATELRDQSNCDGNLRVSRQFARPPKDLDQSSGFIKYAFAYAAGRVPDENLAPWLRPDNELNNRYPAQLVGGVPIAPDSLVGKSCKWGTYCNNPVGMFGMLRTLLAPALQLFANGFGAALTQNLYFWNPIGSATFAGELADGIYGTWRFHNPYTVSVAVGRLMNPELMAWVLDQIPTEDDHTPWSETLFCPWTESLLNLDCIDGAVAPAVPGPNGLVQARACAIAVQ